MSGLTIGRLAKACGVGVETVRFYERKGLVKIPRQKNGSFRVYPEGDVNKILFIKRAQDLGFTLAEIAQLMELNYTKGGACAELENHVQEKLDAINAKIKSLKLMAKQLVKLKDACHKGAKEIQECQVSDCFNGRC